MSSQPRSSSDVDDLEQQARQAIAAWASLVEPARLTVMPQVTNLLWHVDGRGPTLVLKQLPRYPPGVEPAVEFRVLCHLQARGVRVALPLLTDAGAVNATVDERRWVLLPLLPHESSDPELETDAGSTAHEIGAAIGHLDRALADYPWAVESFVDDPIKLLDECLPDLPQDAARAVGPFVDQLRESCSGLPTQLTHGDCNHGNVLLHRGRVSGFIDVDHLPIGPRVRDLAYYLASRLTHQLSRRDTGQTSAEALADVLPDYVNGYHQSYPLSDAERAAIVPLMLITAIGGAHWALHGWDPKADDYNRNLRCVAWMSDNFRELARSTAA